MLTYPSDPLPQIVCPMDEDAVPPNCFCSAPPHSEPPAPFPPFSSITPSCANDGVCGHRRSDRIQGLRAQTPKKQSSVDAEAAQRPSRQNPSPPKRQREGGIMVVVSRAKQPRVESTHEKQIKDGLDFSLTTESQDEQKDPPTQTNIPPVENEADHFCDSSSQNLETTESGVDMCPPLAVGHAFESASAPKGWVIGPLFQSFKSKVASFTEIVMSPVKLFRANSPPPCMDSPEKLEEGELQALEACDDENSQFSNVCHSQAQSQNGTQDTKVCHIDNVNNATVAFEYSKKLMTDVKLSAQVSEEADDCMATEKEKNVADSVPLQLGPLPRVVSEEGSESKGSVFTLSVLLQPSVNVSASHDSQLNTARAEEEQKGKPGVQGKPLPRKCTGNRKRGPAKLLTADKGEESVPEVTVVQLPQLISAKSNNVSSGNSDVDFPEPDQSKIENCHLIHQSLQSYLNGSTDGMIQRPTLDKESPFKSETHSAADLGRARRVLNLDCASRDTVKRKRLTADACVKDSKKQELLEVAPDGGMLRVLRPQRKEAVSTDNVADRDQILRPARKRHTVSTRANKKGKDDREMLTTINEAECTQTERSFDAVLVRSLDKSSSVPEVNQKVSNSKVKLWKRLKSQTDLSQTGVNPDDGMNLETTIAITSAIHSHIKCLKNTRKCRENIKNLPKRKLPSQSAQSVEPLECADFNAIQHSQKEESKTIDVSQPFKRPKKGLKSSGGSHETKQCFRKLHSKTKENQSREGKLSVEPVYFEITPSNRQPCPSPSQPLLNSSVNLNKEITHVRNGNENGTTSVADESFSSKHSSISVSKLRERGVNFKPRSDNQRRCRVLHSSKCEREEVMSSISKDDSDLATADTHASKNHLLRRRLRSYSCPEIPSLCSFDIPWNSLHSPHHSWLQTSHEHHSSHAPFHNHTHKSLHRPRRHTVCSVEVERELAPLCLRKEVYPSRSIPYDSSSQGLSPSLALSPSTSLSVLATCFLSSPLAFLSKRVDRGTAASPSTSGHVSYPTSSLRNTLNTATWHLPGFPQRPDCSSAAMDSSSSAIPLQHEIEKTRRREEDDDGENTSSSSQEFEDVGLREEKALSDSEIKVVQKHEKRGKVSSIRIRKALPKPQNNLTPMGLPKPIRLKKKEFSLEEIYTNKNFSERPKSRLETIFEVPQNRRDGSLSSFGQKRVKRFLEFLENGEARKPKKQLVGVGKAGVSASRTRRGGFPKDGPPSLSVQDVDSLLCAKLEQLHLWLQHDQKDG